MGSKLGPVSTNGRRGSPIANLAPNCISEMYQFKTCFGNSRKWTGAEIVWYPKRLTISTKSNLEMVKRNDFIIKFQILFWKLVEGWFSILCSLQTITDCHRLTSSNLARFPDLVLGSSTHTTFKSVGEPDNFKSNSGKSREGLQGGVRLNFYSKSFH